MKLQKIVLRRKADNASPKTPAGKSKRPTRFVVLGTVRHGQGPILPTKPTSVTPGTPRLADSTKVPRTPLRPEDGKPPAYSKGTGTASQPNSGNLKLSGDAESGAKRMPGGDKAAIPGSPQTVVTPTPAVTAGPSSEDSLSGLLAAVQRAVQLLEQVAEAAAAAQSKRQRSRPAVRPVGTELAEHLAGKQMLDITAVEALVGSKRSTIYGWIKDGKFVAPVRLSPKSSRWVASEVEAWLDDRKRARDGDGLVAAAGAQQALGGE